MVALGYYYISSYVTSVIASGEAAVPHYLVLGALNFIVGTGSSAVCKIYFFDSVTLRPLLFIYQL